MLKALGIVFADSFEYGQKRVAQEKGWNVED